MAMDVDYDEKEVSEMTVSTDTSKVTLINMKETDFREVKFDDPRETLFRFVTSHFYTRERIRTIQSIDIVENEELEYAFQKKKQEFKSKNIPQSLVFAYHGTPPSNILNIITNNFDKTKARRQFHGRGNYFSECPSIALQYSMTSTELIMCKILPGRQYKGALRNWPHFDSKLVYPDLNNFSQILIVPNKDQIVPCAIIHLNAPDFPIPRIPPLSMSFPMPKMSTVTPNNKVHIGNQPSRKFDPNIVFPFMNSPVASLPVPRVRQPNGVQVVSGGNALIGSTSTVPAYTRNFSADVRSKMNSSFSSNSTHSPIVGSRSSRVGQQLGTIAEAVFRPILKKKNSKKDDDN